MKFVPAAEGQVLHRLELTRRNLEVLLAKLDDPLSQRQLLDPDLYVVVAAKEDHVPHEGCDVGELCDGMEQGRLDGDSFIVGALGSHECVEVVPVENEVHYADRAPGAMFMPSTGETL